MAPKASKRTATEAAAARPAKQSKTSSAFEGVSEAIQRAELPPQVRTMLLATLPKALGTPRDQRHEIQEEMVKMIGSVINDVKTSLEAAVQTESQQLSGLDARRSELEAAVVTSEKSSAAAEEALNVEKEKSAAATEEAKAARATVVEAEDKLKVAREAALKVEEQKQRVEKVLETEVASLASGCSLEEGKRHAEALKPLMEEVCMDASLITALGGTCNKPTESRGTFDTTVFEELGKEFRARSERLAAAHKEAQEAATSLEGPAESAKIAAATAEEAEQAVQKKVEELAEALKEAQTAVETAKSAVKAFQPEYAEASKGRDSRLQELENFTLFNVGSFELLRSQAASTGGA